MRNWFICLSIFFFILIIINCSPSDDNKIRTVVTNFYEHMFGKNKNGLAAYNLVSQQPSNKLEQELGKNERLLMHSIDGKVNIGSVRVIGTEATVEVKYSVLDPNKAKRHLWQMIFNSRNINKETYEIIKKDTTLHSETIKIIYLKKPMIHGKFYFLTLF